MPIVAPSGLVTSPHRARLIGAALIGVVLVLATLVPAFREDPSRTAAVIHFRTSVVGDGIVPGTQVRLRGVTIGAVTSLQPENSGRQIISVSLNTSATRELSSSTTVAYAPANLFGISALVLTPHHTGTPLIDGATIDVTAPGRTIDATMGSLLRSLSDSTGSLLTPELTATLAAVSDNASAFAPLISAVVAVGRAVADTQQLPASYLLTQYAAFFNGTAVFANGLVKLAERVYRTPVLKNERAQLNDGVTLIADDLFPAVSKLLNTADAHLAPYASASATALGQVAATVPTPARSHDDLAELLRRLDAAFHPGPDGTRTVATEMLVKGMPGVVVPLLAASGVSRSPS